MNKILITMLLAINLFASGESIRIECIDGYKFIVARYMQGLQVVQIYERGAGIKPPQPIKCMKEDNHE